jgi:hypothetical protein
MLLIVPLFAAEKPPFEHGPRPQLSVFDPYQILDPAQVKEISNPLVRNLKVEGVDVIVVVLKDTGNAPPEHIAKQFADAWCDSDIHCIVLHVPGRMDSPWIVPAGRLIDHLNTDKVLGDVADRERRARAETDDLHKVEAAAEEAADMLRIWMGNAIIRSETIQREAARIRRAQDAFASKRQIALFAGIASLVAMLGGVALMIRLFRARGPGYFPNNGWQPRLGAPHAGGNNAVSDLASPPNRP